MASGEVHGVDGVRTVCRFATLPLSNVAGRERVILPILSFSRISDRTAIWARLEHVLG
jgi:hypothetical protein